MKPDELREWRKNHGYSLKQLGDVLGVAKTTVYRWEKGKREIPSFLHLALECLEKKGGESKVEKRAIKKRKEVTRNGNDL